MRNPGEVMMEEPIVLKDENKAALKDKIAGYEARQVEQSESGTADRAHVLDTRLKLMAAQAVYEKGSLMYEDYLTAVDAEMPERDKAVIAAYDATAVAREKLPLVANAYRVIKGYAMYGGVGIVGGSGFGVGKHT